MRGNLSGSNPVSCYKSLWGFEVSLTTLSIGPFCQTLNKVRGDLVFVLRSNIVTLIWS